MLNKRRPVILVHVETYPSAAEAFHREHQLKRLAQRMANQVQQFGRPIALEPMPPNERRIVHMILEHNTGVTTNSTGDGNQRRVNIQPSLLR